jgi:5'-nucleotidase
MINILVSLDILRIVVVLVYIAGARTAVVFRTSGIAISIDSYHKPSKNFNDAANFLLNYLNLNSQILSSDTHFLNLNFPDLPITEIKGVIYTTIGSRNYYDTYEIQKNEGNSLTVKMNGNMKPDFSSDTDVAAIQNSMISITPLTLDSTDYNFNEKHRTIIPELL